MHVHIKCSTQIGRQSSKKHKEIRNKRHTNEREVKLFSANGIILYTEKTKVSIRKLVTTDKFIMLQDININI